jgi:hypothetical protein
VFLDAFDHLVGGEAEPLDFGFPVGESIDLRLQFDGVDIPDSGFVHLDNEGTAAAEHQRVDVLAARAVEGCAVTVHRLLHGGRGELLDALVVPVAGAVTPVTEFVALAAGAVALTAGPLRLGDVAFEFPVAAVDKGGVDLHLHLVGREITVQHDIGAAEVDFGVGQRAEALADLAVEFRFQEFAGVLIEASFLPQEQVVFLDERRDARPDLIGREVVALHRGGGVFGPPVVARTLVLADPARLLGGVERFVVLQCNGDPEAVAPVLIGESEAPVGEEAAEAGVTERPRGERVAGGRKQCHYRGDGGTA